MPGPKPQMPSAGRMLPIVGWSPDCVHRAKCLDQHVRRYWGKPNEPPCSCPTGCDSYKPVGVEDFHRFASTNPNTDATIEDWVNEYNGPPVGTRIGGWTVVREIARKGRVYVRCDCGVEGVREMHSLKSGCFLCANAFRRKSIRNKSKA